VRIVHTFGLIGLIGQAALLAALAASGGMTGAGWLAGLASGVTIDGLLRRALARAGTEALGPANRVTLTRALLVGGVAALVADSFARPARVGELVGLAVVALVLDAVDGRVARHTRTESMVGARFDMEVDALLILILSVYVARSLGPWVLAIGGARYLLGIAGWALPWLRRPVPPRYWRKVVAAIQGISLTTVAASIVSPLAADAVLVMAMALLAESFGRDVWWLSRRRTDVPDGVGPLPRRLVHG
jgi:phosphatidylglycerophosphate synthase